VLDFLAVGDVMLDVHVPAPPSGGRLHASVWTAAAGSAVNAALAAAELGARAGVVGCVGDDAAGRGLLDELGSHGLDAWLTVAPATTGTAVYIGDAVVADRGANALFEPGELPEARVTLVSGYLAPAQLQASLAAASGLRAVDLQGNRHDLPPVDVVLGPGLDLGAYEARVVCSTLGAEGAVATDGGEHLSAAPPTLVPGPLTGAGDRFAAAFLLALDGGAQLQAALDAACAFASSIG
jgi:sugar/nucleoside kinase (ribokinase family)